MASLLWVGNDCLCKGQLSCYIGRDWLPLSFGFPGSLTAHVEWPNLLGERFLGRGDGESIETLLVLKTTKVTFTKAPLPKLKGLADFLDSRVVGLSFSPRVCHQHEPHKRHEVDLAHERSANVNRIDAF